MMKFFEYLALFLGILTGIITLIVYLIKPIRKLLYLKYKSKPILNNQIEDLFISAYFLLRIEQISQTGLWGKTITKYVLLNFPKDPFIINKLQHYKKNGSITHTAHALKGLSSFWAYLDYKPSISLINLDNHISNSQKDSGLFHPSINEIVNIEEFDDFAHVLRHNSTTLSSIYYLKLYQTNSEQISKYNKWITKSLIYVFSLPKENILKCKSNYGHSLAYMIQCFDLLVKDYEISSHYKSELDSLISTGIETLVEKIENNFWLLKSHPQTKCFYTLLILDILLRTDLFSKENKYLELAFRMIENLLEIRNHDYGLSLGALNDNSIYSISDIGATSRLLVVIDILINKSIEYNALDKTKLEFLGKALKESIEFIQNNYLSLNTSAYNNMTHSYESILLMVHLFDKNMDKKKLRAGLINADEISNDILNNQQLKSIKGRLKPFYFKDFIYRIIVRDIINNPSKLLSRFSNKYWG